MGVNFFRDYDWHSSIELEKSLRGKKIVRRVANTEKNRGHFLRLSSDSDYLIHKSSKALWRISDDGGSIESVFDDDILTEDNL